VTHKIIRVTGGRAAWKKSKSVPLTAEQIEREIRALAKEVNLHRVVFHFKNGNGGGCAYPVIPNIANLDGLRRGQWSKLVVVGGGWGWKTGWIHTLAHEVKHIEQFKRGERGSERPAQAFADWWVKKRAGTPGGPALNTPLPEQV